MQRKSIVVLSLIGLLLASFPVLAQLDLKEKAQLVGVQVDEKPGATEKEKLTDVAFIFTGKPSAYYHTYKDNILTIDFFDAEPGEEKLPDITQAPFTGCTITKDKVDVNKDIEGMEPLLKDIVRVTLPVQKDISIDYTLADDFNVVTLSTVWAKGAKIVSGVTRTKTKTIMLIGGGVVGVTGAVIAYFFLKDTPPDTSGNIKADWNPAPPTLPSVP
jgi:hypothetical protein